VTIGSADFAESILLAHIYGDAMSARGVHVTKRLGIGERDAYLRALDHATIGAVPEYSGSMLAHLNPGTISKTPDDVFAELQGLAAAKGLTVTQYAEAQDSDTITVTAATAARYQLHSIADPKPVAPTLTFGGPVQFRTRADGIPALQRVYGVRFGRFTVTDAGGSATVNALLDGTVDAGDIFSTDPAITTNGFVALEDPNSMFSANNVVPLFRSDVLTPAMRRACGAVSARLDTAALAALVLKVVRDKQPTERVARDWLAQQGLV
jgi:osmoprotectant transport system substrate-binding protein